MDYSIRAVQQADWQRVKEIRLASLLDPVAPLAFLETHEQAVARPDEFWQERAAGSRAGLISRQFVAEQPDGSWLGTLTVLVEPAGAEVPFGEPAEISQTHLVGVFIRPEARGTGLTDELFRTALEWSWALPEPRIERVRLYVHEENTRAQSFYRRTGFRPTGATTPVPHDPAATEIEFAIPRA